MSLFFVFVRGMALSCATARSALSAEWPLSWAHVTVGDELSFVRLFVLIESGGMPYVDPRDRRGFEAG
jgi:hypothetical protein